MQVDGEWFVSTTKAPTIAVLPLAKSEASTAARILQPSGWPTAKGYANGMAADGRIVVTGGVSGWDSGNHLAAGLVGEVRQTLRSISDILSDACARPDPLLRFTWYD